MTPYIKLANANLSLQIVTKYVKIIQSVPASSPLVADKTKTNISNYCQNYSTKLIISRNPSPRLTAINFPKTNILLT